MTRETELAYRRTHADFKCPAGHTQYFAQETAEEAQIRRLKEQKADLERMMDCYREIIAEQRIEMRSLRARLGWRNRWLNGSREEVAA